MPNGVSKAKFKDGIFVRFTKDYVSNGGVYRAPKGLVGQVVESQVSTGQFNIRTLGNVTYMVKSGTTGTNILGVPEDFLEVVT
ncbi:hypothetical protein JR316_0003102 [Psilocybe cubensis]|uniref:Uncharacterized protein n=2 Tax=Psilocybe cubensis TaxID=181762 RepID=A0ACB8H7I2_PSICU|nr:hypothetical protein JR316_0003102 [Psilocybe cubensis]KAH9483632.1 hypothetical protein JR316_0003102 [Psilocybe cubensis]